jgi:hypothetical protein
MGGEILSVISRDRGQQINVKSTSKSIPTKGLPFRSTVFDETRAEGLIFFGFFSR